jgi:undecaprenyl-diphosphatase
MTLTQILLLALLQGLTEFLPISSSGHLILVPALLGWRDQGLAFDVAVHVGTLLAVIAYFRDDLLRMTRAWFRGFAGRDWDVDGRLAWWVLIGTVPVGLAGLLFKGMIETQLRTPLVIALTTIGFGLLLWIADRLGARTRDEHALTLHPVLLIGLAQVLALVPGTSRSGITMTAGLMLGLTRAAAARFSFLLSIPVIALAGGLEVLDLMSAPAAVDWIALLVATVAAALAAFLTIHLFLAWLDRVGMAPFAIYRVLLGAYLLWQFW